MKQTYQVIIEADKLPKDMSKEIACELDCEAFLGVKIDSIQVRKVENGN